MSYLSLPFDPTGYASIDGAQLAQLVSGTAPANGYGFNQITYDDAFGNPTVPSPIATPLLAGFLWLRIGNASNASATIYIWNPNAATNATLLKWQIANISSITSGSITGSQIASLTITDNNIFSVSWSKLPSGAAVGGCLTGSMPNPGLANAVVSGVNITQNTITGGATGNIALSTIILANMVPGTLNNTAFGTTDSTNLMDDQIMSIAQPGGGLNPVGASGKLQVPAASPYYELIVNAASNALQWFNNLMTSFLAGNAFGAAGQIPAVNSGATAFTWWSPPVTKRSIVGTTAGLGTLLTAATVPGLVYTFAHGLGTTPTFVRLILACTSNDAATGYNNGQILDSSLLTLGTSGASVASTGVKYFADNTNVYLTAIAPSSSDYVSWIVPTTGLAAVKPTVANNFQFAVVAYL
jgi:hypothetical protein